MFIERSAGGQTAALFFCFLLFASSPFLGGMDSAPIRVVEVQSPVRISVQANMGGLLAITPIQLQGIRLIGPYDQARLKLAELCPPGCLIILQSAGEQLSQDSSGLAHAWVLRDFSEPIDLAAPVPPAGADSRYRTYLQVEMVRGGWAVIDDTSDDYNRIPPTLLMQLQAAMREARERRMGAYSIPDQTKPGERDEKTGLRNPQVLLQGETEPPTGVPPSKDGNGF